MAGPGDILDASAIDWVVRTADPAFDDWDGFTAWLEADARHAEVYHRLSAEAAEMAEFVRPLPQPQSRPSRLPARGGWLPGRVQGNGTVAIPVRRWAGAGIAACAIALAGIGVLQTRPQPYSIETRPGMIRQITLDDGSRVTLNGGTRLTLDRRDGRYAALESGQALFSVRHDAANPFRVRVGDAELIDIGTEFDVVRESDGSLRFEVSEGAVAYNPEAENIRVDAGQSLSVRGGDPVVRRAAIDRDAVGGWAEGRLDYAGAPLGQVAADLSRTLGLTIAAAPAVATRPFHGTIRLAGLARDPAQLDPLLGVTMRRRGAAWEMTAPR